MNQKLNSQGTGVIAGLLAPLVAFLIYYLLQYTNYTFTGYLEFIFARKVLAPIIALSVLPNLLVFFIFIWTNRLKSARGVLGITIVFAFVVLGMKFIF